MDLACIPHVTMPPLLRGLSSYRISSICSSDRPDFLAFPLLAGAAPRRMMLAGSVRKEASSERSVSWFPGHDLAHGPKWRYPDPWWLSMQPRPDAQARPQAAAAHEQPDDHKASRPRRALRTRKAKEPVG